MAKLKLTQEEVDKLKLKDGNEKYYYDLDLRGFGVYLNRDGSKTYFVHNDVKGKSVKSTIGKANVFTFKEAKKVAKDMLKKMSDGINPNDEKRAEKAKGVTLKEALDVYLAENTALSEGSRTFYKTTVRLYLADWEDKALVGISADKVIKKKVRLEEEFSPSVAHGAMRTLRAIFSYFIGLPGYSFQVNPVKMLTEKKIWPKLKKRTGSITIAQFPRFFKAVLEEPNETIRDYILLLLFTGVRRAGALVLEWKDVDFNSKTIALLDVKKHTKYLVPMSLYLYKVLKGRQEKYPEGQYVFPGSGKDGHLKEPRYGVARIAARANVDFNPHDLRRTYTSVASHVGIPDYSRKKLLNHSTGGDVTNDYDVWREIETLRGPVEQVAAKILELAGQPPVEMPDDEVKVATAAVSTSAATAEPPGSDQLRTSRRIYHKKAVGDGITLPQAGGAQIIDFRSYRKR